MSTTAPTTVDTDVILRARGITKRYGGVHALKGVDFEIRRGKVTTLFGENGAGKSTLMKILSGVEQPTSGTLELRGKEVTFSSANDALDKGIAIIHQELNLAPNLSVSDNIFMGRELRTKLGSVDYARQREVVRGLMERLEENIDPRTLVSELRLGQQQIVEIAGALAADAQVLIMDEPTSALSAQEVEVLFKVIDDLTSKGVAIVYISHHLEEALHVTDHAVVFRDGALVANEPADNIDMGWVIEKMVGHATEKTFEHLAPSYGEVLLEISDVRVPDPQTPTRNVVDGVSIEVRAGEVVCIYGLMGAGRTELMEAVAGRLPMTSGTVRLGGRDVKGMSIRERIALGLGLVPEDRQRDGLVQSLSVGQNMALASLPEMVKGWFVSRRTEDERVKEGTAHTRVKTSSARAPITSLSGGNQQKVVISKMLLTEPKVLLLDEPTRGIDVGAKGEIFTLLAQQAQRGIGVLFVTSEINEALNSSNRIIVMSKGRIVAQFDTPTADRQQVMAASGENTEVVEAVEEEHHHQAHSRNGARK
jgi:erythritol transport system ATP-binding protein